MKTQKTIRHVIAKNLLKTNLLGLNLALFGILAAHSEVIAAGAKVKAQETQVVVNTSQGEQSLTQRREAFRKAQSRIEIGQVITSSQLSLKKVIDEVVVEEKATREGLFLRIPFLFTINYGNSSYNEETKMVERDVEKSYAFTNKQKRDIDKLKNELEQYVRKNIDGIIALKVSAIQLLSVMYDNSGIDASCCTEDEVRAVVNAALALDFIAEQDVRVCTKTNYAEALTGTDESVLGKIFGFKVVDYVNTAVSETKAHSNTECSSQVNRIALSPGETSYVVSLSELDRYIRGWANAVSTKTAFELKSEASAYPTFGNPYFK